MKREAVGERSVAMIRFKRWAAPVALLVVLGAAPALANEGNWSVPVPEQVLLEAGLTGDQIDFLRGEGLSYVQIYVLQAAADYFGVDAVILYQGVAGSISWGKLMKAFDVNFGAAVAAHQGNAG
jgi:hypothetical protein